MPWNALTVSALKPKKSLSNSKLWIPCSPFISDEKEISFSSWWIYKGKDPIWSFAIINFFSNNLSEGIFLGTTNPVAKKIYESLGWESVQNSNVMFNSNHKKNFEKFLIDYYDQKSKKQIIEGNPNLRLSIIPYVLSLRSKKQIDLNSNINLIDISSGCLSIYNKFDFLRNNQGNWYCQSDQNNKIFSIVSYLDDGQKNFRIDGLFNDSWKKLSLDLLHEIVIKIYEKNPKKIFSEVFSEDFYKIDLLQEIGFNFEEDIKKTVENNVLNFKPFSL